MGLLTGSWVLDALLVLLPLLYWYATRNYSFWKKRGVPYVKPKPLVGNMAGVATGRQHMGDPIYECYLKAGDERFMGMFAFDQPLLMFKDPELVGRVLATDFASFYSLNFAIGEKQESVLSRSLFGVTGPRWKALRSKLTPGFTSGKMKRMFQLVDECGCDLVQHLAVAADKGSNVEVLELMACYTTDVVCSVFMGVNGGSLRDSNSPMRQSLKWLVKDDFVTKVAISMAFLAPKLLDVLGIQVVRREAEDFLIKSTEETMAHRKKNGIVREDAIDMMMHLRDGNLVDDGDTHKSSTDTAGQQFKMDTKDIAGQIMSFLSAGYDTSASTMTFTLYELALNQELQDQLRQQVKEVAAKHGGNITYEALAEMTDLHNTISETLRMYPVVNFLDRRTTREYHIPGTSVVLPKDTGVVISVTGLHYDPRFWKQPHRYIPDRFKEENSKGRPSYTYMPFGDGPRQCIGMRMGQMQVRLGLAHILRNFRIVPTSQTPVPLPIDNGKFIMAPRDSLPLSFQRLPEE